MITHVTTVPLKGLAIPFMAVCLAVLFELALQLTALLGLSLTLGISLVLPTIGIALAIAANLVLGFHLALSLNLPSFDLKLSLSIELALILSLIVQLEALLDCDLLAYGYFGPATGLGAAISQAVPPGGTWPDGTPADEDMIAFVFAGTIPGPIRPDQVSEINLVQPPPPAPEPTNPPPPPNSYPPPQAYTAGLARLVVAPPPDGGPEARGSVSVDSSVSPGIGAVTGVSVDPLNRGSGYASPPAVQIVDAAPCVAVSSGTPVVVTLPDPLGVTIGHGFGCTVSGVTGGPTITAATATSPIVVTVPSTAGIATAQVGKGDYGLTGLVGNWHVRATSSTTAELWLDKDYTIPTDGQGAYTTDPAKRAKLVPNVNGKRIAKVITSTTVELYEDPDFLVPVVGVGSYSGGTLAGAGMGAVANATMGGGALQTMRIFFGGIPFPTVQGNLAGGSTKLSIALGGVFPLIGDLLNELNGRASLLGGLDFTVTPPSITASLDLLAKIEANLQANLNVQLPDLTVAAAASVDAQVQLIADLVARIGLYLGLDGDILVYKYEGPGSGLGAAIAAGPGSAGWADGTPASQPVVVGVFGITNPATAVAFKTFFPVAA